jgi:hypothetical protein
MLFAIPTCVSASRRVAREVASSALRASSAIQCSSRVRVASVTPSSRS